MQAIGLEGATASEIGRRLGVSKQAAGKTVDRLEAIGYAERADGPDGVRRKPVRPAPRGLEMPARCTSRPREHLKYSSGRVALSPVFGMIFGPIRPPRMVLSGAVEGARERRRVE
ncbi:MarR family transcriptional regulator [Kitasatospora sp. NPDC004615]|uniref:MarR family transcriptional regulator n=1 Tax=Kitasatospora sp. NPDC004615 TaxID=3364017 RepID=UPI0036954BA4